MSEVKFEVNDKVKAFGCEGVVKEVYKDNVSVIFSETSCTYWFFTDGKLYNWNKEPSLVLVEKAKKEVVLHEYLIKIRDAYFTEFHETDEGYKKRWYGQPIIKTGRTITVEE